MTLAQSFSSQWLATAYGAVISLLLTFMFGRLLGPEIFGFYNYLLTLASLFAIFQDGGFRVLIFRELTSPTFQEIKDHLVSLAQGHNLMVTTIGVLICLILPFDDAPIFILAILSFGLGITTTFFSSQIRGEGQFAIEARWRVMVRTLTAVSILAFIFLLEPTIQWIFVGGIIGYCLSLALRPATCKLKVIFQKLDPVVYKSLVSLLIIDIATLIYFKIDIVMLRHLGHGLEEVGYYSAGTRLMEGLIFIHLPFATVLFREMRTRANDSNNFMPYIINLFLLSCLSPFLIVPAGWFWSEEILHFCFGAGFKSASSILDLLLISFFFMIPNLVLTQGTLAIDREHYYAKITCVAALVNIGLNLYLIPTLGAEGAAFGTIATEGLLMILIGAGIIRWRRKLVLEQ